MQFTNPKDLILFELYEEYREQLDAAELEDHSILLIELLCKKLWLSKERIDGILEEYWKVRLKLEREQGKLRWD